MTLMTADKPVVLVVEDHDDTREMLRLMLGIFGCRVLAAANGDEAIRLAEQILPDLILMDVKMPRFDGLSVTRVIRSHPTLSEVPIVAVTGMVTPQFRLEALDAGCNQCLDKPIDFDRLEKLVKALNPTIPRRERAAIATLSC